jgi:hypothetical protein
MITGLRKQIAGSVLGLSILALGTAGCGTLTGATLGGATGAGIGAATHHNVGRSAAIGAGVGAGLGALYDVYQYNRRYDYDYYGYRNRD